MWQVNLLLLVVGLTHTSLVWGICTEEPDWIHAYCHSKEAGLDHIYFLGTVIGKNVPANERRDETVYTFQVKEAFAGNIQANQQLTVHSSPVSGIGKILEQGSTYLIETHVEEEHNEYEISICDYTSFGENYEDWQLQELRSSSFEQFWCSF